jgi:hypothetical protein
MEDEPKQPVPLPASLPLPPEVASAIRNLEQSIFMAYASTSGRSDAFVVLEIHATLHRSPTRASLAQPAKVQEPPRAEEPMPVPR